MICGLYVSKENWKCYIWGNFQYGRWIELIREVMWGVSKGNNLYEEYVDLENQFIRGNHIVNSCYSTLIYIRSLSIISISQNCLDLSLKKNRQEKILLLKSNI